MELTAPAHVEIDRRKPRETNRPKDYGWFLFLIVITLLMIAGYFISYDKLYKSGDKIGYNMGLVGGVMMLSLLLYPLRKRIPFMKSWGVMPKWFKWHMVFGILGPTIIIFHSTFSIGSVNAGVALVCMMLVSGSGIFGRMFYTKIHYGLYGRRASYVQLHADLEGVGDVKSILSFAPNIQQKLILFRDEAMSPSLNGIMRAWYLLTLGIRSKWMLKTLTRELRQAMYADAPKKKWSPAQIKCINTIFEQNKLLIKSYINSVQSVSQLETYERLFSIWHIFHLPLVYMLVFSSIWHVIAVHRF